MGSKLLAIVQIVSASASHAKVMLDCGAFERRPDGTWTAMKTTSAVVLDVERQSRNEFVVDKGELIPVGKPVTHQVPDAAAALLDDLFAGFDLAGELNASCRAGP